jgi:hypothetical protein
LEETTEENEFEKSEVFDTEEKAQKSLGHTFRKKGFVKMPEGFEHIFVEQFEDENTGEIARIVWLGNIRKKTMKWNDFPPDKWQVTIIKPGHKNYEKAKKLEL